MCDRLRSQCRQLSRTKREVYTTELNQLTPKTRNPRATTCLFNDKTEIRAFTKFEWEDVEEQVMKEFMDCKLPKTYRRQGSCLRDHSRQRRWSRSRPWLSMSRTESAGSRSPQNSFQHILFFLIRLSLRLWIKYDRCASGEDLYRATRQK